MSQYAHEQPQLYDMKVLCNVSRDLWNVLSSHAHVIVSSPNTSITTCAYITGDPDVVCVTE